MKQTIIKTTQELNELCKRLSAFSFITIDTEFIREKTYWPNVCLIQLASKDEAVCVDPLAEGIDLSSLFDLMQNEKVLKVFHAARQDIEIFYHLSGKTPFPVFDTQVGAMVCGFGESISYQNLVHTLLGVELDKSMRFTDWQLRPLNDRQIEYALADVTYLQDVYLKVSEILENSNRTTWVEDEIKMLLDKDLYENNPEDAWKKLKIKTSKPYVLANCKALAAYREKEAQRINRPRKYIMRDEMILEIAMTSPKSAEELSKIRGLQQGFANGHIGKEILKIIDRVRQEDSQTYPSLPKPVELPRSAQSVAKLLRLLLTIKAVENDVAEKLIATFDEINLLAKSDSLDIRPLKGWRYDVFGKYALALKEGKLTIGYNPKEKKIKLILL